MTATDRPAPAAASPPELPVRSADPLIDITESQYSRLRRFNLVMAALHAVSGTVMLALSNDFSLPVVALFRNAEPGGPLDPDRLEVVDDLPVAAGTVGFLYLSALFHLIVATVGYRLYRHDLARGMNRLRWVEYSFSATLMIVLIAMLTGIEDIAALIGIAGANVAMILFGWLMEAVNPPGRAPYWGPFVFGCIAGAVPWIAVVVYIVGSGGDVPTFVYFIFVTIFVFFNCFAVNQFLQYQRVGKWRDYLFGESAYIVLSLTAKSALAWQIFGNVLAA